MPDARCQMPDENPLIVALDVSTKEEAIRLCQELKDKVDIFKVGLELFLSQGKGIINIINAFGKKAFLDIKLCDIPNQVSGACEQIVKMGVYMFTVHISGGRKMLEEATKIATKVAKNEGVKRPKILGVTVLTSFDQEEITKIGISRQLKEQVVLLARLGLEAGLDGVVASPKEAELLREMLGDDFLIVTPGIRYEEKSLDDHRRTLTPREAIEAGASYIVVGRPIIKASHPVGVVEKIMRQMEENT